MAGEMKRWSYVKFDETPQPSVIQKNLAAVMTATDTQINSFSVGRNDFEILQIGAASSTAFTPSSTGWLLPVGTGNGNGLAFCQGSMNVDSTRMKFTTGTDAFYLKVGLIQSVVADTDVLMIGFREAGTTQVTTTPAEAKTDYDHKALFGVYTNAGAMATEVSNGAGVDVETVATSVSVTTVAMTLEVRINADLTCEFYKDGVADVLATAAASKITTGKIFVPHLIVVSTAAGVEKVELLSWECGLQ